MTQDEILDALYKVVQENKHYTTWTVSTPHLVALVKLAIEQEREACAKVAETPIGEYEVVVACGTEPTPHRIPQYANWQDIAKAIRARGQA
jgi:hypothetical protein